MKKEIFVFVTSDSIRIYSESQKKELSYEEKGIRNITPAIMALLIRESLDELNLPDENIIIALGSEFITCTGRITTHVKKSYDQETSTLNIARRTISIKEVDNDYVLSKSTRYICDGKTAPSFVAVQLLQKYFAERQCIEFESVFTTRLLEELDKNEVKLMKIVPADSFLSVPENLKNDSNRQIALIFEKNQTIASVCVSGKIQKIVQINNGMRKIAEDVSNNFNLSVATAQKLIDLYGFVFLPKEYLNYVIDVPVYGSVFQNIALSDLTFCIRESLKDIYTGIITALSAKMRDYDVNSFFISESYGMIKGMDTLLKLTLNQPVEFTSFDNVEYLKLQYIYNILNEADIEEQKVIIPEQLVEPISEVERHVQPPIMERLSNLFNARIKPFLLEAES